MYSEIDPQKIKEVIDDVFDNTEKRKIVAYRGCIHAKQLVHMEYDCLDKSCPGCTMWRDALTEEFKKQSDKPNQIMETKTVSFGEAVTALKEGKRVARQGWNGKGLFIFMQVPADISMDIVPKMQSLPESVKKAFEERQILGRASEKGDKYENIHYRNQLAMVYPDNTIYGWVASPSDVLENDWVILDA